MISTRRQQSRSGSEEQRIDTLKQRQIGAAEDRRSSCKAEQRQSGAALEWSSGGTARGKQAPAAALLQPAVVTHIQGGPKKPFSRHRADQTRVPDILSEIGHLQLSRS
ncbi:hypothetical protein L596_027815 [Steinernema carpocapsae]|uniref:Uncharacterized protein n=1 Tax=Steinernema carpocapsae TaxID=34508 RepID=A0A4U5LWL0_STECR|nr:hypothetical protein L596_027815 [Steinernema carpocapsae]